LDESHFDESAVVLGSFVEACEDAAAFFEPADESLDDVASPVVVAVKAYGSRILILVRFGGNDRRDVQAEQILVDPISAVSFVACQRQWPGDGLAVAGEDGCVGAFQQFGQHGGFVVLPGGQMEVQRMPMAITKQMEFCGKAPAGAA